MKRTIIILTILAMTSIACKSQEPETVKFVDLEKYSGVWYEIAAFPTRFEKGCSNTTAEYQISEKGHVIVINRCTRENKRTNIKGKAFIVPNSSSGPSAVITGFLNWQMITVWR
jgi:apolipoprotein D and lipocalin family protein